MSIRKEFVGMNICVYDPIEGDTGSYGSSTNTIGYNTEASPLFKYTDSPSIGNVGNLTSHLDSRTLVLLNLHRNGVWGYSSWKQLRSGQNPLTRNHIKNSTYSFYGPGTTVNIQGFDYTNKYGPLEHKTEPMVSSKYAPLQYNFGYMMKDSRLAEFTLKADLTNECRFFTHDRMSELFAVELLTSEDYEQAKTMYLDNALNNSTNPIDSIELIKYRETVYPRESNTFLNRTRHREKYLSGFWTGLRKSRNLKTFYDMDTPRGNYLIYNTSSDGIIFDPSIWPLDTADNFSENLYSSTPSNLYPIGFDGATVLSVSGATSEGNNGGRINLDSRGILQNTFSQFRYLDQSAFSGSFLKDGSKGYHLKDAPTYYHRHATRKPSSLVSPSGMPAPTVTTALSDTYMFNGDAIFQTHLDRTIFSTDNDGIRTLISSSRPPFYDSYDKYTEYLRIVGKDYSLIPEFAISKNLEFYLKAYTTEKNLSFLRIQGASHSALEVEDTASITPEFTHPTSFSNSNEFYNTYSNSDFLKMFDIVETDNKDTLAPSVLKLTCKAIKKFLPYNGFYASTRTVQIADQFYKSYKSMIKTENGGSQVLYNNSDAAANLGNIAGTPVLPQRVELQSASAWEQDTTQARIKPINTAMFSPGILFNTIKSGIACDWPNIQASFGNSAVTALAHSAANGVAYIPHTGNYTTMVGETSFGSASLADDDYCLVRKANLVDTIPSTSTWGSSNGHYIDFQSTGKIPRFDNRIPFEALSNPEEYMSNYTICDSEGHPSGNTGLINTLSGVSDNRYKLMMNNFLAEVPKFFLKRKRFTTFQSLKQGSPNFGVIEGTPGENIYGMRIKIRRTMKTKKQTRTTESGSPILVPQDQTSAQENFTMYSRPSAFGPATCGISPPHNREAGSVSNKAYEFDEYNHRQGYNFPFTPPYYHGESWCDILFLPTAAMTGKITIDQIFENSRMFQLRFWQGNNNEFGTRLTDGNGDTLTGSGIAASVIEDIYKGEFSAEAGQDLNRVSGVGASTAGMQFSLYYTPGSTKTPINYNAMQVSSSLNIFTKSGTKDDVTSFNLGPITIETNTDNDDDARWIIQSKFETPTFNFNHVTNGDLGFPSDTLAPGFSPNLNAGVEYNQLAGATIKSTIQPFLPPRGLWHQHGRIPNDDEGIFIEITDIPEDWYTETKSNIYEKEWEISQLTPPDFSNTFPTVKSLPGTKNLRSLADLVGFPKNDPIIVGELADRKIIKEAVIAVPFKSIQGRRKYFEIDRRDINDALKSLKEEKSSENTIGRSIIDQVELMQEYVIPPEMDFLSDETIDPFAMYMFEFKHELTQQDLSDIWQNILPDIGVSQEKTEVEISHELLSNELLGTGRKFSNASKVIRNDKQTLFDSEIQWMVFKVKEQANKSYNNLMYGKEKEEIGMSYNWPYDYFSLVELVKIEAEVELSDVQEQDGSRAPIPVKSKRLRAGNIDEE